ncbi:MAG: hypothetical protein WCQ21_31460, partial [Verrucomicrobiota bacterium]
MGFFACPVFSQKDVVKDQPTERVLCRSSRELSGCLDLSPRGRQFCLSFEERVGVRGNGAHAVVTVPGVWASPSCSWGHSLRCYALSSTSLPVLLTYRIFRDLPVDAGLLHNHYTLK